MNDQRHLLRSINPARYADADNIESRYHYHQMILDQGQTSACTGAALWQFLDMGPVRNLVKPNMYELYKRTQAVDEWPGEEPAYYGSSVRASFKVAKALGFVDRYGWAFDVDTAIAHVLTVGPLVFGTSWFSDMMDTDRNGFIRVGGREEGGHAYAIKGASRVKKCPDGTTGAFRGVQSWGKGWGQRGLFWLSFKDADALIRDQGEACTAYEIKAPAAT